MTVREIIQRVKNLYSKGTPSDDSRLTSRHIYNKLLTLRSKLITQELNRKRKVSRWNYQILPCVELIEVAPYECSCLPNVGCNVLRTRYKLPKSLVNYNQHIINSVSSLEGSIKYTESSNSKYKKGNKYTSNNPDYYIENGYLYTTYLKGPRVIKIEGIFEDPNEVSNYPSYCGNSSNNTSTNNKECTSILDTEFPIESDLIDILVEMSFNELINIFSKVPEDLTNDSKDSLIEHSK